MGDAMGRGKTLDEKHQVFGSNIAKDATLVATSTHETATIDDVNELTILGYTPSRLH